ncbi:hypothetical protein ICN35_10795 [Polynucleobacter sp. es-GGE-1]|uniref:Wzz/FepE/Etk N-terminal domain-containing protein n=1 Tax=Polynucleobacter sp. es-GGE-1 TaxID=1819724 RepID=UPI001C0DADAC|nr:Wzz/FepE/Etk N-terminal domain-containing protein [Polynucleobacter sp. es-GGE-1]MBU3635945.1 hypothetical protein [Polynucleobacter sp. es-GGE-1]
MTTPYSNNTPVNPDPELTLGDVVTFVIKAKWFALAGIAIGIIVAIAYLTITPSIYESRIVIQIQPSSSNVAINQITVSSDELLERLMFSQTADQIINIMQPTPNMDAQSNVRNALKLASISKGGVFLNLTVKSSSAAGAQELAGQLGNGTIAIIKKLNVPKIAYLEKLLNSNKALLASNNAKFDMVGLQTSTLGLEALLSSPESLQPNIVDGPSPPDTPTSPKSKPILLLGVLLGMILGLLLFHFKQIYIKK